MKRDDSTELSSNTTFDPTDLSDLITPREKFEQIRLAAQELSNIMAEWEKLRGRYKEDGLLLAVYEPSIRWVAEKYVGILHELLKDEGGVRRKLACSDNA